MLQYPSVMSMSNYRFISLLRMPDFSRVEPMPWKNDYVIISQLMGTCHYRDYDFMNQSGQYYIMCEYVGWHVGNSKVGFLVLIINRSWARADNFSKILQNSQTFAHWGQQSLRVQTKCYLMGMGVEPKTSDKLKISKNSTAQWDYKYLAFVDWDSPG